MYTWSMKNKTFTVLFNKEQYVVYNEVCKEERRTLIVLYKELNKKIIKEDKK